MKKNSKGFTLVELVIVCALMGIIMGAVLGLLKPTNTYYEEVKNLKNQEVECVAIAKQLSYELKYAKGVQIFSATSSYSALPTPTSADFVPSNGGKLIVIKNNEARGTMSNTALGKIMYATNYEWNDPTNPSNSPSVSDWKYLMDEGEWGKDAFKITIGDYGTKDGYNSIMFNFEATNMTYNSASASYERSTTSRVYKYQKAINFTNINYVNNSISIAGTSKIVYSGTNGAAFNPNADTFYIYYVQPK